MVEQEYKFILVYDTTREHWIVGKFAKMGAEGWIFRGEVTLGESGPHYVFSRPKPSQTARVPLGHLRKPPTLSEQARRAKLARKLPADTD